MKTGVCVGEGRQSQKDIPATEAMVQFVAQNWEKVKARLVPIVNSNSPATVQVLHRVQRMSKRTAGTQGGEQLPQLPLPDGDLFLLAPEPVGATCPGAPGMALKQKRLELERKQAFIAQLQAESAQIEQAVAELERIQDKHPRQRIGAAQGTRSQSVLMHDDRDGDVDTWEDEGGEVLGPHMSPVHEGTEPDPAAGGSTVSAPGQATAAADAPAECDVLEGPHAAGPSHRQEPDQPTKQTRQQRELHELL